MVVDATGHHLATAFIGVRGHVYRVQFFRLCTDANFLAISCDSENEATGVKARKWLIVEDTVNLIVGNWIASDINKLI